VKKKKKGGVFSEGENQLDRALTEEEKKEKCPKIYETSRGNYCFRNEGKRGGKRDMVVRRMTKYKKKGMGSSGWKGQEVQCCSLIGKGVQGGVQKSGKTWERKTDHDGISAITNLRGEGQLYRK